MSEPIEPYSTATEQLAALEAKQISARELLALHEDRIARYDALINVVVQRNPERAQSADQADQRRARGEHGALLGLPITLKESMNVKGLRTTVGATLWADHRADQDGAIAARTRAEGAVLLGKTNVPPFLTDWQTNNSIYGRTNNPWDLTRTPGGSTGGAAAVAAGLTPLEYGSDIAGSIRVPAAFCGVYGHRPSDSAVPRSGQFPFPPMPNASQILGVQGPLARSAEDLELGLLAVAGPEVDEEVGWRLALPAARHTRLADFRVAVLPTVDWVPTDPDILEAQERLVARLRKHGCKVEPAQPPALGDHRESYALYTSLLTVMLTVGTPPERRQRRLDSLRTRDDAYTQAERRGLESSAEDYLTMFMARERLRAAWRAFFRDWDVLIAPAFCRTAFPHLKLEWPSTQLEVAGKLVPYNLSSFYPQLATLPGQPATAFPVELSREGLPIGLQAIGPYLEDLTPIRFAAAVAREWGGFVPPPAMP